MMHMHQSSDQACVCTLLRKASRAVTRLYDERLTAHGLTVTQFAILRHLARNGDLQLNHLAERLVMERTSLYRTIAPVARAGWVAIEQVDGRAKVAHLTPAGRDVMDRAESDWSSAQSTLLGGMDGTEWRALQGSLDRLTDMAHA
jgi:DNA-binding MarR family transcriptional regulator